MTERDQAYLVERGIGTTWSIAPQPGLARLSTAELKADVRDWRNSSPLHHPLAVPIAGVTAPRVAF
jgi:hypothetical protein